MQAALTELVLPNLSIPDFIRTAKEAGFESVELGLSPAPERPFRYDNTEEEIRSFRQVSDELNMPIKSITIARKTGHLLLPPDEAKDAIEEVIWGLECAVKLGATVALHTLGVLSPDLFYEDAYNNGIRNLRTLAPVCEKLGVSIGCEFIWNGFLFSPLEMRNFLEAVNSPNVGFYFDTGNMAIYHYPQHWVRALGKFIKRVHVKDFQGEPGNCSWPGLLEGKVDFPAVMAELHRIGYDGPLVSEVAVQSQPLTEQVAAIRKIMAM